MNADHNHNNLLPKEREVPLIVLNSTFNLNPTTRPQQSELYNHAATKSSR